MAICPYCSETEVLEIHEIWNYRDFQIETCCEGMHEAVVEFMNDDPKGSGEWLKSLSGGVVKQLHPPGLRRIIADRSGVGQLVLDWNIEVVPVAQKVAKDFVRTHHRHCPPPAGWRFGAGVTNGPGNLIGVIMVGRPVARALDQSSVLEVNRLCVRDDITQGLTWNACSLLYGWASKQAKKRGFKRIITYTLDSECGTTLKAAGWKPEFTTKGGSWNSPSRPRKDKTSTQPKVRWTPAWCSKLNEAVKTENAKGI